MMRVEHGSGRRVNSETQDWNGCIERIGASQDKQAFSDLFTHFAPFLKSFLLKGGGLSAEHAEELVQETMIKVWRKAPTFSASQASASTWIYTIARNNRIDWLRKNMRYNENDLDADDIYGERDEPTPYSSLVQIRSRKHINELLQELPAEQSEVLKQMYFQGKSGQEVADTLGLPLGTVKSRIRLALKKMKVGLTSNGNDALSGEESYQ